MLCTLKKYYFYFCYNLYGAIPAVPSNTESDVLKTLQKLDHKPASTRSQVSKLSVFLRNLM